MPRMRILSISGSLREHSRAGAVARAIAAVAPTGVDVEVWQDAQKLPLHDNDDPFDGYCGEAWTLRGAVHRADAVVVSSGDAEGLPASLKNVLEWLRGNLGDVPVLAVLIDDRDALLAASALTTTLTVLRAHVDSLHLEKRAPLLDRNWELSDETARNELRAAVTALVAKASTNPQRVSVKAAIARAYAARVAFGLRETVGTKWPTDEPPLLNSACDALVVRLAGGGSESATYGACRLVCDAAGRGVLLTSGGSSGNPRDGFFSSYGYETIGTEGWTATGTLTAEGWEDPSAHRLRTEQTCDIYARTEADLAAARDAIADIFAGLGFVVETK
jgi:NAD(P)H-dependent FMN reductase